MIEPARYGQPACDCGHPWGIHDVYEYPGDDSETCCVDGCSQDGCPGRRTSGPEAGHRDAARPQHPGNTTVGETNEA